MFLNYIVGGLFVLLDPKFGVVGKYVLVSDFYYENRARATGAYESFFVLDFKHADVV